MADPSSLHGEREKRAVALTSVAAAVFLAVFKLVVGLMTGSLGILAEAAHSGLDLVAALITFLAVRVSDKPADSRHLYGHGKVENLSALVETLLLLLTCVWIIYEAIRRLFFEAVAVEASFWAFLIMGISIVIDINRSRLLYAAARKHGSQALEADALHFSTDIWSSSVVILGLLAVRIAEAFPQVAVLAQADAVAALFVAAIIVVVSVQLGKRTIEGLLDTAPGGMVQDITRAVEVVPGVAGCNQVRVRPSGPYLFVDVNVVMDGEQSLEEAHALTEKIEEAVRKVAPRGDVMVHPEPKPSIDVPMKTSSPNR
jgi:cation diffusion facilitator family transporter